MLPIITRDTGFDQLAGGAAAKLAGNKYLLAIGIDAYRNDGNFKALKYPTNDAKALVETLQQEYGFDPLHTYTLFNENSTEKKIRNKIIEIKNLLKNEDSLVVFFAGHGAAKGNTGYWIPFDYDNTIELNLSVSVILDLLIGCCSQVLLIVDCCFSGSATDKAYPKTLFSELELTKSKFSVITSGNNAEKVPDKSVFIETLLDILKTKNVNNLERLIGDIKTGVEGKIPATTVTSHTSNDQLGLPFILQRKDMVAFELTNSFFELNYTEQVTPRLRGIRLFNLIYLRGSKESGHHIFTHRYFREAGNNSVTMFNYIPYIISFGRDSQSADYSLWKQLAKIFGYSQPDPVVIIEKLLKEIASKNWLLIAKVDGNCDDEAMEEALIDFWEKVNDYLIKKQVNFADYPNNAYIFIWDRRGDAEDIPEDEKWKKLAASPLAKFLHLPPVKEIDVNEDLVDWHFNMQGKCKALACEELFANMKVDAIQSPYSIENVICQVTELCNRREVYENLFIRKNLWIQ